MPFEDADISTTVIDGRIESLYIIFRKGEVADETIRGELSDGTEALVDVDRDDVPIAVQLLISCDDDPAIIEAIRVGLPELHSTASSLVDAHRAKPGRRPI